MKKLNVLLIALGCGLFSAISLAEDAGNFPGYVASPNGTGSNTVVKTQYGECVHNQYFKPEYAVPGCDGYKEPESEPQKVTVTISESDVQLFAFDKDDLTESGKNALTQYLNDTNKSGNLQSINIVGYTDSIGSSEYNQKLSVERANVVKAFFVSAGIKSEQITATGRGEENTIVSQSCIKQYGKDDASQLNIAKAKLRTASKAQKAKLQAEVDRLQKQRDDLIKCAAADRRVEITSSVLVTK